MATFLFFLISLFVLIILNLTCLTNYAESLCLLLCFFNLLYHGAMDLNLEVIFPFHPFTYGPRFGSRIKGKKEKKNCKPSKEKILVYISFFLLSFLLYQTKENSNQFHYFSLFPFFFIFSLYTRTKSWSIR